MFLWLLGGLGGELALGQLKYRCLPVGGIPFSHDLHLRTVTREAALLAVAGNRS